MKTTKNKINTDAVDHSTLRKGAWSNVTRLQVVRVLEIYPNIVEYYWEGSALNDKIHTKSREHFLRSYVKI